MSVGTSIRYIHFHLLAALYFRSIKKRINAATAHQLFFTVSPGVYEKGIVNLIPQKGQAQGQEVLNKLGENLKKWLKGKIFSMSVVLVLTAIGLGVLGMPLWLVLAIIAGILNFIPNSGPLIAMAPAVLVALMQGLTTAIIVAAMYIFIPVLESSFITRWFNKS